MSITHSTIHPQEFIRFVCNFLNLLNFEYAKPQLCAERECVDKLPENAA
jgi:hypothetical protein